MERFVDRENELTALEREFSRPDSSLVVVYGRRRVGKTALITRFIEGKNALYYLATEESEMQNMASFQSLAADFLDNDLLRHAVIDRWEVLFQTIADAAGARTDASHGGAARLVVVLDEFQYLGKANAAFPSVFQRIWDTILKPKNVMVILCGSLISMMESQVLSYDSPLYGRRTAQMRVTQIPFRHYREFLPSKSARELVEWYAVTGGVPKYVEMFDDDSSDIYEAVERNVFDRNGFLYDEPLFLLRGEVADIGTYFSLIKVIANGSHRPSEIAAALGVPVTAVPRKLSTLLSMDILEREVPVTEANPEKSKRALYKIKDNFIRFWFRFVQPNVSYIESGHTRLAVERLRRNLVDNHVAFVYEDICRERVWDMAESGSWPFMPDRVGRWWNVKGEEIDVVAVREDDANIAFGECKFWKHPVGLNVLRDLEAKAADVVWRGRHGERREWFVLFSISGFTDDVIGEAAVRDDVMLVDDSAGAADLSDIESKVQQISC